ASFESYRVASPVTYRDLGPDRLVATATSNPASIWKSSLYGTFLPVPSENEDAQYRRLFARVDDTNSPNGVLNLPGLHVVGQFDPSKLPGFSPLSQLPLETYYPPVVVPSDAASRRALDGGPLLPTANVGGYIAQPPLMLTTLQAASLFFDPQYFSGVDPKAPISVIRVRVAGVMGPDPLSLAKMKQVALAIQQTTGLAVDITAGSSPTPMTVDIPPGKFGQPALTVTEGWVKQGVAVVILQALDRKSLAMFLLVLVVTSLFLVNGP